MNGKRNLGVDLLRIFSMYLVVVLHVLGQGGILTGLTPYSPSYYTAWLVEVAAYCAVDCFGLISGYVSYRREYNLRKLLPVWAQAAVYSVGITVLFRLFVPGTVGLRDLLLAFFPAASQKYWYFTAYFGLFFFLPFLNLLVNSLDEKLARRLAITLIAVFSLLPAAFRSDLFFTRGGYTFLWLAVLYLLGACLGRYGGEKGPSPLACLGGYALCLLLTWGSKLALETATIRLFGEPRWADTLVSYTSPTVLFSAVFLLLFFRQLPLRSSLLRRGIGFFSPLAFGVYLIHTHPLVWNHLLAGRFAAYTSLPLGLCIVAALLTAAIIFLACALIDLLRMRIFHVVLRRKKQSVRA